MIIYGCITEKLDKKEIEDISIKQANQILNKSNITAKSLPGHGNLGLRKKGIKPFVKEKRFIKIWYYLKLEAHYINFLLQTENNAAIDNYY